MRTASLAIITLSATASLFPTFHDAEARIINVPNQRQTIQAAIDVSSDGDTVLVQPGIYSENINFNGHALLVASLILITNDRAYIDSTIIDAGRNGPGVVFENSETEESILRGFLIRNGVQSYGGGIDCQRNTRPSLIDLHITSNWANSGGGGIHCSNDSRPLIEGCLIDNNGAGGYGGGGLSAVFGAYPVIRNSKFNNNSGTGDMGGGAIWLYSAGIDIFETEISENISSRGGGIYATQSDSITIRNSSIHHNSVNDGYEIGGGIAVGDGGTVVLFDHVSICDNSATTGGAFLLRYCTGELSNLTVVNNQGEQLPSGSFDYCELTIRNSIFRSNNRPVIVTNEDEQVSVDYCNVENGRDGFGGEGDDVVWGENNIDSDPLFVDPDNGDYHLTENSPCIDAGDPESEADSDWSRADIGAYLFIHGGGFIGGVVLDARTNQPVAGAELVAVDVLINDIPSNIIMESNEDGVWGGWLYQVFRDTVHFEFWVTAPRHSRSSFVADLAPLDSIWIEIRLDQANFIPSIDSLVVDVDSGGFRELQLSILNDGNGVLTWEAESRTRGWGAGLESFSIRDSIPISQITGDPRIEGVVFDGERYYVSGANGEGENTVYILNRDGAMVGNFLQHGSSRYGYKDMDWDGEYIWAAGEDTIYCLSRDGAVVDSWADPLNPSQYVAFDRANGIIWLSGTTTDIHGYDRRGNDLGRMLDRQGLRIYGLGWLDNDPDGSDLYIVNKPGADLPTQLHKMNSVDGDASQIHFFANDSGSLGFQSAFICRNFDKYQGSVLMTVLNRPDNLGGDRLDVYQLYPNTEWLSVTPDGGEIQPGGEVVVQLTLKATADDGEWNFDLGEYEGEIRFANDGENGDFILPVYMTVIEPNAVDHLDRSLPQSFDLEGAFPNPFNSTTTIKFSVGTQGLASLRLAIYGVDGRIVTDLLKDRMPVLREGEHSIVWNADGLPGGIYLVKLESGQRNRTMKVALLK